LNEILVGGGLRHLLHGGDLCLGGGLRITLDPLTCLGQ